MGGLLPLICVRTLTLASPRASGYPPLTSLAQTFVGAATGLRVPESAACAPGGEDRGRPTLRMRVTLARLRGRHSSVKVDLRAAESRADERASPTQPTEARNGDARCSRPDARARARVACALQGTHVGESQVVVLEHFLRAACRTPEAEQ